MFLIATRTANKVSGLLEGSDGIAAAVTSLSSELGLILPELGSRQIVTLTVTPEISERSTAIKYPLLYVYCTKLVNDLREKFRRFSGEAQMVVEARVSLDRLEQMNLHLHAYVDAITQVLDNSRGDWGDGVLYCGGYEVSFGAIKQGGRNFIQAAKVSFVLEISSD